MSHINLEFTGPVACLTLDHTGGNRINFVMREELLAAVDRVAASDARVLIVRGKGADFCLGGDVRDWPGIPAAALRPRVEVFATALDKLDQLKIPTIAAVQGGCMGGGFELALGCDLIVAARSAHFVFPEARLGIMTLQAGVIRLTQGIGGPKALELVLLSDPVAAEQMAAWNVVSRVVEDDALEQTVEALAARLAAGPPGAYAGTKALLDVWTRDGWPAARRVLYDISMPLFDTMDVQNALRAAADAVEAGRPFPTATFTGE
jgi:enoyl-CoA hydratase/carnithine racemase